MKKILKRLLTGLSFTQEYLCVDKSTFRFPARLLLEKSTGFEDVTDSHVFLGYRPLILALVTDAIPEVILRLLSHSNEPIAHLRLKRIITVQLQEQRVIFFEGVEGSHLFLSPFHTRIGSLIERTRKRSLGNADLQGNNYEQVRIAYAIPRTISLISVRNDDLINLFPTDLHGPVGTTLYISSLRKDGMANSQVETYKEIVLSEVLPHQFRYVYALGKNHMKPLRSKSEFEWDGRTSSNFGHPLPKGVVCYRELRQVSSFDHGIHRIHIYEVVHQHHYLPFENGPVLAHVHSYFGQWRRDRKIDSTYLIR